MELRDLAVTPLVIIAVFICAYFVRPYVTDERTRRFFFPALSFKIIGAIALGVIYQFYYTGGDTFSYHTHGSRPLWEAFVDSPIDGIRMFFSHGTYGVGLGDIGEKIWFWRDPSSFFIIQIAACLDLLTFSSYSATAVLFSVMAFTGGWMLYYVFYKTNPDLYRVLAICCLFVPSVIFWGSGILKDTVTFTFLGVSSFCIYRIIFERRIKLLYFVLLVISFFVIFSVKKYILISLIAATIVWISSGLFFRVRSLMLRVVLVPLVILICMSLAYLSIKRVLEDDSKYSLDRIATTSMITAYDIRYGWGARQGDGSGYTLGKLDGTWQSMIVLAPSAINVTLFRPYFWEVNNPLMALSAIESFVALLFTSFVIFRVRTKIFSYLKAEVIFCLVFALIFAFGVGISTYNFGTLSRYKVPLLPFYWSALVIIYYSWKADRQQTIALEVTQTDSSSSDAG